MLWEWELSYGSPIACTRGTWEVLNILVIWDAFATKFMQRSWHCQSYLSAYKHYWIALGERRKWQWDQCINRFIMQEILALLWLCCYVRHQQVYRFLGICNTRVLGNFTEIYYSPYRKLAESIQYQISIYQFHRLWIDWDHAGHQSDMVNKAYYRICTDVFWLALSVSQLRARGAHMKQAIPVGWAHFGALWAGCSQGTPQPPPWATRGSSQAESILLTAPTAHCKHFKCKCG